MFSIYRWIKKIVLLIGVLLIISCIIITEQKYSQQLCKNIDIQIAKSKEQLFINTKDVFSYLSNNNIHSLDNVPLKQIESKKLENIIQSHDFVRLCKVYKTWKGIIKIYILPKRIVARVMQPLTDDCYIDEQGSILPLSTTYTARVLLVNSEILCKLKDDLHSENNLHDISYRRPILEIFSLIDGNPFWKAQITHLSIDNNNEIIMHTQFNRHTIHFGKPDNIKDKMEKLEIFYKDILPSKGWNKYKHINIKFDNQIVCSYK